MLQIGLTGNIGSGKTTVCKIFEILGVPVFYADQRARLIMEGVEVKKQIVELLGNGIVDDHGALDRKTIASVVFNDETLLRKLNEIIHPAVREEYNGWVSANQTQPYLIQEAAILFESGLASRFDKIIVVAAPLEVRIDRVMKRDSVSREQVLSRAANQFDQEILVSRADFVIHNDDRQLVIHQVIAIDNALRNQQQ